MGHPLKKRTDSKKGPSFDPFGRKTGVGLPKKSILFCTFSRFSGFPSLEVVVCQGLPEYGRLPKKSCRKTYCRFFDFRGWWHNRCMNDENEEIMRRSKEKMGRWKESHGSLDRPRTPTAGHGW
jgi:hypothetical protein